MVKLQITLKKLLITPAYLIRVATVRAAMIVWGKLNGSLKMDLRKKQDKFLTKRVRSTASLQLAPEEDIFMDSVQFPTRLKENSFMVRTSTMDLLWSK
jgi:hypothetical protein